MALKAAIDMTIPNSSFRVEEDALGNVKVQADHLWVRRRAGSLPRLLHPLRGPERHGRRAHAEALSRQGALLQRRHPGTAGIVLAGLTTALQILGAPVTQQRVLFLDAGSAALGIPPCKQ
jgi:Malic enzyme, NAD binding domain